MYFYPPTLRGGEIETEALLKWGYRIRLKSFERYEEGGHMEEDERWGVCKAN